LALATLALVVTAIIQHNDAVEAISATRDAAEAARRSADAADGANKLNANVLRPWIPPDIKVLGIHYDASGTNVQLGAIMKNTGKTPALHVWLEAFPYIGLVSGGDPRAEQKTKCDEARSRPIVASEMGHSIFPEQSTPVNLSVTITKAEIETLERQYGDKVGHSPLLIIGCINYQFARGRERHQSGFIYWIQHKDGMGVGVIRNDQDLPGDQLWLEEWFLDAGAFYAD
jgi:hypothetical protein